MNAFQQSSNSIYGYNKAKQLIIKLYTSEVQQNLYYLKVGFKRGINWQSDRSHVLCSISSFHFLDGTGWSEMGEGITWQFGTVSETLTHL